MTSGSLLGGRFDSFFPLWSPPQDSGPQFSYLRRGRGAVPRPHSAVLGQTQGELLWFAQRR